MHSSKKILCLSHYIEPELGIMKNFFVSNGFTIDLAKPFNNFDLPETINNYSGVIILGGAMNTDDTDEFPGLIKELEWIKKIIKTNIPIIGICLGAQLIAKTSGSKISYHKKNIIEIGYKNISIVSNNPLITHCPNKVYHWHQQGMTLPSNAEILACNSTFDVQAYVIDKRIFGFQFHPEVNKDMIENWNNKSSHMLSKRGTVERELQLVDHIKYQYSVKKWFEDFLQSWIKLG